MRNQGRGFGLVRRMTGGRAVLHQHELTYSLVIHDFAIPRVSGGVVKSYRKISAATLVAGLQSLGADVEMAPPNPALHQALVRGRSNSDLGALDEPTEEESYGAVCFDVASDYELTAGGRKIVGSAQARRGGALLQHGSILLDVDWDAWASGLLLSYRAGQTASPPKAPDTHDLAP